MISGLFISCGTSKNIFDESIPADDSVTLVFEGSITVKSYNGINVDLKTRALGNTGFTIPAGETTFFVDIEVVTSSNAITGSRITHIIQNVELKYNFETGKKYLIRAWFTDEEGKVAKSNIGRGLRMSLIVTEGGFYNAVHIVRFSN